MSLGLFTLGGGCECHSIHVEVRIHLVGVGSPSAMWVMGTKFRLLGLTAGMFTCLAMSVVLRLIFDYLMLFVSKNDQL